jgi:hypothetical protein
MAAPTVAVGGANTTTAVAAAAQSAQAAAPPLPSLPPWYDPARFEREPTQDDNNNTTSTSSAAREAVAALRRAAPGGSLAEVTSALEAHLAHLQAGIAEAVNADYGEFVALPGKLAGLDAAAGRMRAPLERAAEAARQAQRDVRGELAALRGSLARRQAAAEARATLELMQEAAAAAHKLEALIAEADGMMAAAAGACEEQQEQERQRQSVDGGPPSTTAATATATAAQKEQLAARGRLLERAAGEAGRLAFLSARGEGLAFLRALAPRAAAARAALDSHLRAALADALAARDWPCATHCLRACVELGDGAAAEAALRSALAGPVIRARLEAAASAASSSSPSSAASPQQPLLDQALSGLLQAVLDAGTPSSSSDSTDPSSPRAAPGARVLLDPSAGFTPAVDLPGAVVLAELNDQLGSLLPGSFGFASLPAFRANHAAARKLLRELEGGCPTEASLERLRASPAWSSFSRRWNLPVYFSLQYQAIAGGLEEACASAALVRASAGGGSAAAEPPAAAVAAAAAASVALAPTAALAKGLDRCFSPAVYVPQLGDRFFRLACQLAARYSTWVADVGAASAKGQGEGRQQQPEAETTATDSAPAPPPLLGPDGTPLPGAPSPIPPASTPKPPLAWASTASPSDLALVCADADAAAALLRGPARDAALVALKSCPEALDDNDDDLEAQDAARRAETAAGAALEASAARVEASARAVLRALAAGAVARCVAALQQVKGVTATYRMTSKGPPTRHSHYAATVLAPLAELLQGGGGASGGGVAAALSPASRAALASGAVAEVAVRFHEVAEEVLSAVRKTETSLQRLKKNRAAAAAAAGGGAAGDPTQQQQQQNLSDSDKIALQLLLDALEFGRRAAALGVALEKKKKEEGQQKGGDEDAAAGAFAALVAAVRPPAGSVPLPEGAASGLAAFGLADEAVGAVEEAVEY